MAKRAKSSKQEIRTYEHVYKERVNNPPVGLVTPDTDPGTVPRIYKHDPHIDLQLIWTGKEEHTSFEVPTVSLHVHEHIDPRTIIDAIRKRSKGMEQLSLFHMPDENWAFQA